MRHKLTVYVNPTTTELELKRFKLHPDEVLAEALISLGMLPVETKRDLEAGIKPAIDRDG